MSNLVIASGVIKGKFEEYSNDGVIFTLVINSGSGANSRTEEFTIVAYSNVASKLKTDVEPGNRVVFAGRVASEKINDDKVFHNVINASKVLAVTEESYGSDYIVAIVSALATAQDLQYTPNGAPVVNMNLASSRSYEDRETKEIKEYVTYLDGTLWNSLAESAKEAGSVPMKDESVLLIGTPRPNAYKNKEGAIVNRINVWALELFAGKKFSSVAKSVGTSNASREQTPKRKFGNGPSNAPTQARGKRDVFED